MTQREDFGVRRRVVAADRSVGGLSKQRTVGRNEHGADGHFTIPSGGLRAGERAAHAVEVERRRPAHSHSIVAGGFPETS